MAISTLWRRKLGSICATSGIHAEIWQVLKSASISETAVRRVRMSWTLSPVGERDTLICATSGILANSQTCKLHGQIWQFWKSAIISETAADRAKRCSISASWDRKRVYVQLLELWPMAKLVVKQSAKAHGPLVYIFYPLGGRVEHKSLFVTHPPSIKIFNKKIIDLHCTWCDCFAIQRRLILMS